MELHGRSARARAALCAAALALALGGCTAKSTPAEDDYGADLAPFDEAVPPSVYVPKVKALLTGLPATAAEVQAAAASPTALRGLVDQWMALPQFRSRMLDFFRNAFQQNNVTLDGVSAGLDIPDFYLRWQDQRRMEYALMDSFPLTAWQLVQEGRPFTETVTTRRYMMTTAMMALLSYADMFDVPDGGGRAERLDEVASLQLVLDPLAAHGDGTPLTAAESTARFAPGSSGAWTWRIPVQNLTDACRAEILAQRATDPGYAQYVPRWDRTASLLGLVFGGRGLPDLVANSACQEDGQAGTNVVLSLLQDDAAHSDWDDWRMVTVETIPISEPETLPSPLFWDVPALRAANTLRLKSTHVGFFGTLAWFGNWPTNESNQARVTANQALIVAIGQSIIPAAAIAPAPVSASDSRHSTDPACAACHLVLDPLRQFFRQSYTFSYHEQRDLSEYLGNAAFLLGGMNVPGRGVADLARILASHPHFALGWAQKLQFWANSNAADESDWELQHVARVFQASGHDFRTLVREVFTSPLVTLARGTATYRRQGVTTGIARRDQLCAILSSRLGLADACHQRTEDAPWSDVNAAGQMIATDLYYRAAELPSLPRNPDLFFRSSLETVCGLLASRVVDSGEGTRYSSASQTTVDAAVADLTATLMGLPASDPRAAPAARILSDHFAAARAAGAGRTSALRSTFVLACTSPAVALVGL